MDPFKALVKFQHVCGVYRIHNTDTGSDYVGSSTNVTQRINQHKNDLRRGVHANKKFQEEFDRCGADAYRVELLEECEASVAHEVEAKWLLVFEGTRINSSEPQPLRTRVPNSVVKATDGRIASFRQKVVIPDDPDACWGWTGRMRQGCPETGRQSASRFSFVLHGGRQPGPMVVRHTCDNPVCTNPRHLVLGTHKDNAQDKSDRFRSKRVTEESVREMRREFNEGATIKELTKKYGVNVTHIVNNRSWNDPGYVPRTNSRKGRCFFRKGMSMDWDKARRARALKADGWRTCDIARELGVDSATISNVVYGKIWVEYPGCDEDLAASRAKQAA